MPDQVQGFAMPSRNAKPAYPPNWGNGIWGATPIGSGMKSANETNRTQSRPAPLVRGGFVSEEQAEASSNGTPDEITGSGSLLPSSESEGVWNRRWPSMGNINTGLGNGLNNSRNNHAASSPVRHRTNQHTRSSSPYYTPQPSAIGTSSSNKSTSGSMLDPTSRSFNASGIFNGVSQTLSPRQEGDDPTRRIPSSANLGNFAINGNVAYSGYNSSAASRSGSIPPSRHDNEQGLQFGELPNSSIYPASADPFSYRQPHHSRNSTFSMNGNLGGSKFSNQAWQTSMGDLSAMTSKMDLGKDNVDKPYASFWDQSNQAPSPGSITSLPTTNYMNQRHGSLSVDTGPGLTLNGAPQYSQQKNRYSPTGSDFRNNDSPFYINTTTPPVPEHARGFSTNSSRTNLDAYNQVVLERKLRGLAEQQGSYQSNPSLPYRNAYNNSYDFNTPNGQNFSRVNPQVQQYYPNTQMAGYAGNMPSQRMPPRGPASEMSGGGDSLRSPLLEEFRLSKGAKRYELKVSPTSFLVCRANRNRTYTIMLWSSVVTNTDHDSFSKSLKPQIAMKKLSFSPRFPQIHSSS